MVTFNLTFQLSHSQYTDTVAAVGFFITGLPCISLIFRIGYGGSSQLAPLESSSLVKNSINWETV